MAFSDEELGSEEVEIWGIPPLADERSNVILLKFLRARGFKVKNVFTMLKNIVRWRKEFGIDALVLEDFKIDWDKVFTEGHDKQGHPLNYNVFGEFENKELYNKTFSDEEKRNKFIRWRIQLLDKSVRSLDFSPTAISTIVHVNDLKNSLRLGKSNLRQATNQALQLLQDNYPEFVAKQLYGSGFEGCLIGIFSEQDNKVLTTAESSASGMYKIVRPPVGESNREMPLSELKSKYRKISSLEKAQSGWEEEYEVSSKQCMHGPNCKIGNFCTVGRRLQEVNVLGGLILPVWGAVEKALSKQARLSHRRLRVVRIETTVDTQRIVGLLVPNAAVETVLQDLAWVQEIDD